jgi:hypothetical protein
MDLLLDGSVAGWICCWMDLLLDGSVAGFIFYLDTESSDGLSEFITRCFRLELGLVPLSRPDLDSVVPSCDDDLRLESELVQELPRQRHSTGRVELHFPHTCHQFSEDQVADISLIQFRLPSIGYVPKAVGAPHANAAVEPRDVSPVVDKCPEWRGENYSPLVVE